MSDGRSGSSLGRMVRALREQGLLTQEELAARAGLSVGMIRNLEAGRIRRPRASSVRALADVLATSEELRQQLTAAAADERDVEDVPATLAQLPAAVPWLVGRAEELKALDEFLSAQVNDGSPVSPVVISAIGGTAGVGKSALALHAAHRLANRYPDGQLYVDLRGATAGVEPLDPVEVLGRFLRALGVDLNAIPAEAEEAAARLRSELAGRRLLMVLDNARDAAQVRPLLPGTPGCGVLVTSRRMLTNLDGARHLHLSVLNTAQAVELLGRLAGAERVMAEQQAAAEIARCCGNLPLALRIAGARLAARPDWPLRTLAERLADQRRRLDELELTDSGVRASFAVSHQELSSGPEPLDHAAARAFGLLGLPDGTELGVPVAARLLDDEEPRTERLLERLVDAQLLDSPSPGRYRLHDLLRLYARELAAERHPAAERAAALNRTLEFNAATAWHTLALLRPSDPRLERMDARRCSDGLEFDDATEALEWLETERANLLAAVEQAAGTPGIPDQIAIQLAHALFGFLLVRNYYADLERINQTALRVARRTGDRAAQAQALSDLGSAFWYLERDEQALACFRDSLAIRRQLGDRRGQAASLGNLSVLYGRQKQFAQALTCEQESLAIYQELGDHRGQAVSLGNLGIHHERLGQYDQALACQQESLTLNRELGDRRAQAVSLNNLGTVHGLLGSYEQALACLQESLAICRELGDRSVAAATLHDLGVVNHRQGLFDRALAFLHESLATYRDLGDRHGQGESLRDLGITLLAQGNRQQARAAWLEALAIFEKLQAADADQIRAQLLPSIEAQ
ncbi:MAG TPA: tetratricopeptide repeat protein [Candidatus Limnocylindrales bacterium]